MFLDLYMYGTTSSGRIRKVEGALQLGIASRAPRPASRSIVSIAAVATDDVVAETVLASIMVATLLGAVLPGLAARRSGQSSEREVAA